MSELIKTIKKNAADWVRNVIDMQQRTKTSMATAQEKPAIAMMAGNTNIIFEFSWSESKKTEVGCTLCAEKKDVLNC